MKEGKLVRGKIPEIIIADGKKPITIILNNELKMAYKKYIP